MALPSPRRPRNQWRVPERRCADRTPVHRVIGSNNIGSRGFSGHAGYDASVADLRPLQPGFLAQFDTGTGWSGPPAPPGLKPIGGPPRLLMHQPQHPSEPVSDRSAIDHGCLRTHSASSHTVQASGEDKRRGCTAHGPFSLPPRPGDGTVPGLRAPSTPVQSDFRHRRSLR